MWELFETPGDTKKTLTWPSISSTDSSIHPSFSYIAGAGGLDAAKNPYLGLLGQPEPDAPYLAKGPWGSKVDDVELPGLQMPESDFHGAAWGQGAINGWGTDIAKWLAEGHTEGGWARSSGSRLHNMGHVDGHVKTHDIPDGRSSNWGDPKYGTILFNDEYRFYLESGGRGPVAKAPGAPVPAQSEADVPPPAKGVPPSLLDERKRVAQDKPQTAPGDNLIERVRRMSFEDRLGAAEQAAADKHYVLAAEKYKAALKVDPDNEQAQQGLAAAQAAADLGRTPTNLLDEYTAVRSLRKQEAIVQFQQYLNKAEELRQAGSHAEAQEAVGDAKTVLDQRRHFLPAEYSNLRDQAVQLGSTITEEQRKWSDEPTAHAVEIQRTMGENVRREAETERGRQIQDLLERASQLQRKQEYERSLQLIDQALLLEPENEAAEAWKKSIEDSIQYVPRRKLSRQRDLLVRNGSAVNDNAMMPDAEPPAASDGPADGRRSGTPPLVSSLAPIPDAIGLNPTLSVTPRSAAAEDAPPARPHTDLMTFPAEWAELTERRLEDVDGDGPADTTEPHRRSDRAPSASDATSLGVSGSLAGDDDDDDSGDVGDHDASPLKIAPDSVSVPERDNVTIATHSEIWSNDANYWSLDAPKSQPAPPEPEQELAPAATFKAGPVNPFVMTARDRFSTFALDVDTASYSVARNYIRQGYLPPPAAVLMEEFVNAFDYNYPTRTDRAFAVHSAAAPAPFGQDLVLLQVGVKGKVIGRDMRKAAHLVFVIDTSGSMARADRLPLVQHGLKLLVGQLAPTDRVSVVTYGTKASLLLEAAPGGEPAPIHKTVAALQCQGSTNLAQGLKLGYQVAVRHFMPGQINRVILLSDGVANIGATEADAILAHVESYRGHGITFTSVGFGGGSYNDVLLEKLANRGDGAYVFVDSQAEAQRVFHDEIIATLQTIALDAKIQVEFDPQRVRRYRLIGYENRAIADQDFRNDTVDAGEVGSGQSSTALYELELLPGSRDEPADLGTVYVRYHDAETGQVEEISQRLTGDMVKRRTPANSPRFFLAACAAEFAEILRGSEHAKDAKLDTVEQMLHEVCEQLPLDTRARELLGLVKRAKGMPAAP